MKVAIIGARGIGKHHASWFYREGCTIVSYYTRTEKNKAEIDTNLRSLFPFTGRAYHDVHKMLKQERPDIVVVSTPPETHSMFCNVALRAGAHVFCEKPLVWEKYQSLSSIMHNARRLFTTAEERGIFLGINTQYSIAIPFYHNLLEHHLPEQRETPKKFYFEMESKGSGSRIEGENLWIDAAPQLLSMLLAWAPEGHIENSSIEGILEKKAITVKFIYRAKEPCQATILYRINKQGIPFRRFGINDYIIEHNGRYDENRIYKSYFHYGKKEIVADDLVQQSIRKFLSAVRKKDVTLLPVPSELALKNLEMQATIHDALYGNLGRQNR